MCGIACIVGNRWEKKQLQAMVQIHNHRGPDDQGVYIDESGTVGLGHNRLSIIDLSSAGHQPMANHEGTLWIVFNGEIYNYLELRADLNDYPYKSQTDTEVILAAYERWGVNCVDHFIGMFSIIIWDSKKQTLFAARDRFGVKPLYYSQFPDGGLALSSEIKALHKMGIPRIPDPVTWSTYLTFGVYEHSERTFWQGINTIPPGHTLTLQNGKVEIKKWYDVADRIRKSWHNRSESEVMEEYQNLLNDSIRLRFRSDVPVGINLSGGLDSSILLGLVHLVQGPDSDVSAFTFITGDKRYDELPWVQQMLEKTHHPHHICRLRPAEVPDLADKIQCHEDEPFGGFPTLAYAKIFANARENGVIVLLDGQGLDEQWAGYDYYASVLKEASMSLSQPAIGPVQGSNGRSLRPECLMPEFHTIAKPFNSPRPFSDALQNLQYRDVRYTKIPRTVRFNDRISMMHSTELREPFLDHRLFEMALSQPPDRKIRANTHKWLLREMAKTLLPDKVVEAPKRPLQTPQREWLRGVLKEWATECIEQALRSDSGNWLDSSAVRREWQTFCLGQSDNSFYVWQWISLGLMAKNMEI